MKNAATVQIDLSTRWNRFLTRADHPNCARPDGVSVDPLILAAAAWKDPGWRWDAKDGWDPIIDGWRAGHV